MSDGENPIGLIEWITNAPERLGYKAFELLPFLNMTMVWNEGISFGLFNDGNGGTALPLIILSLIISTIFAIWLTKSKHVMQSIGLALVIGGALGNVIDRFRFGAVMDFIDIHAFGYHYPSFNIADSAIVIGVGILIIYAAFIEGKTNPQSLDIGASTH